MAVSIEVSPAVEGVLEGEGALSPTDGKANLSKDMLCGSSPADSGGRERERLAGRQSMDIRDLDLLMALQSMAVLQRKSAQQSEDAKINPLIFGLRSILIGAVKAYNTYFSLSFVNSPSPLIGSLWIGVLRFVGGLLSGFGRLGELYFVVSSGPVFFVFLLLLESQSHHPPSEILHPLGMR